MCGFFLDSFFIVVEGGDLCYICCMFFFLNTCDHSKDLKFSGRTEVQNPKFNSIRVRLSVKLPFLKDIELSYQVILGGFACATLPPPILELESLLHQPTLPTHMPLPHTCMCASPACTPPCTCTAET